MFKSSLRLFKPKVLKIAIKVFRIDFSGRGNYTDVPNANKFALKGAFGFHF